MIRASFLILLASGSLLTGCGLTDTVRGYFGGEDNAAPPAALVDFTPRATIIPLWEEDVGKGADELFIKLKPALLDRYLFTADARGNIAALDPASGQTVWEKDTELPITGGPGADETLVSVGTGEGEVIALSVETGLELWRARVSSEILSPPREAAGVVIVRAIDGKIFALEAATGRRLWLYDRGVPALTLRGTGAPVIADGRVIAGFDGGQLAALELKTGRLVWEQRVAVARGRGELERMVDIDAAPLVVGDFIYVATFQANVSALALDSGQIFWQRDISAHAELAADSDYLYVSDEKGHVRALDRFSGETVWTQEQLAARGLTGPAISGNKLVVGDFEGYLHWLDKASGRFSARNRVSDAPILSQAVTAADTIYVHASDGVLSAFNYLDKDITDLPQVIEAEAGAEAEAETEPPNVAPEGSFFSRLKGLFIGDGDADDDE